MACSIDPLVVGKVIGDVIDIFVPSISMSVYYSKRITNGCDIKPSSTAHPPTVQISGKSSDLFTLVMTDPDAPSPSEPTLREWVHWIVLDIPGGSDPSQGKEILPYMGPQPPVGIHRYIFVLFQQKTASPPMEGPTSRANFKTREFAEEHGLGLPVATVYFNAMKEPASKRR
ncbi:protein MOTHER of FT and TFL1 [Aristolochia californica]|uniref:protein MOTHER of FT and TFL1 n=1 Tax=Aristolochia californica TaxID=171875 RepID=UPI0035D97F14